MRDLLNRYGLFSLLYWFVFGVLGAELVWDYLNIYIYNLIIAFSYFLILKNTSMKNSMFYTERNLSIIIFWYSLIAVAGLNLMYYIDSGTFSGYNAIDELRYDKYGHAMAARSFYQGIIYIIKEVGNEDFGAIFYIGTIYRIIESQLIVNFVNILCVLISAIILFRIGQKVMSIRYAFMSSLAYFISSFILYFDSVGLKESVFVMIVLITFSNYYNYLIKRKILNLFIAVLVGSSVLFFRPAVLGMIVVSLGIGSLLFYSSNVRNVIISVFLAITFVYLFSTFERMFVAYSSFQQSVLFKGDVVAESGRTTAILAALIASIIGPLPTFIPRPGKEVSSLYAAGLMMRVLLAAPFWLGVIYIIKQKRKLLYGFLIMVLIESATLFYILESYELRYHLLHLPFVFLIGFYYLSQIDLSNHKKMVGKKRTLLGLSLFFVFLVFYWNLRYI